MKNKKTAREKIGLKMIPPALAKCCPTLKKGEGR